ncbi:class I SAM-dependent methyltransferase [Psychroflexus sp. CAK1W]|uniref:class I SAM-dependent methyltransferase n=1 Tax=Psychroflexus curvus TaxID=2873595 RepID=UPI001CCAB333|nr:class I SAM-dependent methyltransferase [Psychroflexus curvus]MBZ9628919.1 class I SAM-dependent methyltransferase [Psychroflexus curvus]
MIKINSENLKAQPEKEDFKGKYEDKNFVSSFLVNNYFKSVLNLINKIEVSNAHEIGVGEGYSTEKLKKYFKTFTASEFLPDLVSRAKNRNPDIEIFQENIYELKFNDEEVDLTILLEVLEHLDYPKLALKELKRISKKYLIIGVPREPIWRVLNMSRFKYLSSLGNTPGHLNHWSKKSIVRLVNENFGEVIAVENPLPWTIVLAKKKG